jgi:hypothetical protein
MLEENWSLERFCLGPELRNFYSQYLWGFSLELFDFIGITEEYEEDFRYFSEVFLGVDLPTYKINVGHKREASSQHIIDSEFRHAIEAHHSKDMELYRRAVGIRMKTRGGYDIEAENPRSISSLTH